MNNYSDLPVGFPTSNHTATPNPLQIKSEHFVLSFSLHKMKIMCVTQSCCKEIDYGCKSRRHCNHVLGKVKECLENVYKLTSFNLGGIMFILNVEKLRFKIMRSAHSQLISDVWETIPYNCLIPNLWSFIYDILDLIPWELWK